MPASSTTLPPPHPWRGRRARAALLWSLAAFLGCQAGLAGIFEYRFAGLRDEEYTYKLALLQRRRAETPARPLVLFMGTSRTLHGVVPGELPRDRLAFNFGYAGAGTLKQLLLLRRLLAQGIRPEHIYLEVMPAFLAIEYEACSLVSWQKSAGWQDWPVLRRYWPKGRSRLGWCLDNLLPEVTWRKPLLGQLFAGMLTIDDPRRAHWKRQDAHGFLPCALARSVLLPEQFAVQLNRSHQDYLSLLDNFHIAADEGRAVRDFLELCRQQRIGVTLVLMPESSAFRSWYGPQTPAQLDAFLSSLRRDYGVAVVDARTWVEDEGFFDGHHLLVSGALTFTRRFLREVYRPCLASRERERPEPSASERCPPVAHAPGSPSGR